MKTKKREYRPSVLGAARSAGSLPVYAEDMSLLVRYPRRFSMRRNSNGRAGVRVLS